MTGTQAPLGRAGGFCEAYGLTLPILMAPMAGACPPALATAVANAGGLGGCGALLMQPDQINAWVEDFRRTSNGAFQMNLWIPDPTPARNEVHEAAVRAFLGKWGPEPARKDAEAQLPDFDAQCRAMLECRPRAISSIMGLFPSEIIEEMKRLGIAWFATATTVGEAVSAAEAGADAIIAQGMEAGGHRGAFQADAAEGSMVGSMALIPAIVDAVTVPVIAAGGIADGRGVAASLILGASAVMVGTALLRSPEAAIAPAWADALGIAHPEDTVATRAFSGRLGRSLRTAYVDSWQQPQSPLPAPYPIQRNLTQAMREEGVGKNDLARIQAWAGQSARLSLARPAAEITRSMWAEAKLLLAPAPA